MGRWNCSEAKISTQATLSITTYASRLSLDEMHLRYRLPLYEAQALLKPVFDCARQCAVIGQRQRRCARFSGEIGPPVAGLPSPPSVLNGTASMSLTEFLLLGLPAVLLTGLSKGGFGGALGGIAVPLLALGMVTS